MDTKTIFVLTAKGQDEVSHKTSLLYGDIKRALSMMDGVSTFAEISKRAAPSLRSILAELVRELVAGGFIDDKVRAVYAAKITVPPKPAAPKQDHGSSSELDFTTIMRAPSAEILRAEAAKIQAEQKNKQDADALKLKAEQEAKLKAEAEAKAKQEAEAARLKAEHEAKLKAEAEAKAQQEAEAARLKAEQEEAERRARAQAEFARLKAQQEAEKAQQEAELARQKAEAEAARLKAEREAERARVELEAARVKAEQLAAQAKEEAERVKREAEAQAKAIEEAARKAKQEAEAARQKAEQEAARVREELDAAKRKAEQENKARLEAEAARLVAEQAANQARMLAEQVSAQEREQAQKALEQQALLAREEEQKRAKQHALSAASTQIRDTPYDTSKPPESAPVIKLDAINLDALEIKPVLPESAAGKPAAAVNKEAGPSAAELAAKELAIKEQAKQAEAARIAEEAAARKLADAQAKAWAEAELRASEAAKAHASHMAQQAAQAAEVKLQTANKLRAATRPKRKPLPWAGISVGLLVLAVLAILIVPMALPTQEYAAKLEKRLADELQQPVHVGKFAVRILPTPRVDLGELYIGEVKQIKAQQAQLSFGFGALFGEIKRIDKLELQGAELNGVGLLDVPVWLQKLSADAQYPISRIVFSGGKLNGDAIQVADMDGEVNFNAGKFTNGVLRASGGKMMLDIKATPEGKLESVFNLRGAALPLFPNWNFEDLSAKGELTNEAFEVADFDGHIAGGVLDGKGRLSWKSGWSAQASLNAKSVTLANISKLLEGDMDGVASVKMQAATLAKLAESSSLDGSFVVKKGVINGVDLVETARLRSKENLPGGRTHFDQMDSALNYNNGAYHFKAMKITNSVMNSSGYADIVKQQLSGKLSTRLSITEGMGSVDLQVGGMTDNPSLRATR